MSIDAMTQVWKHSRARGSALLLLLAIADHAHDDGTGAWPSVASLAKKCRQSERNVQRLLHGLEGVHELKIEVGAGPHGCNAYAITVGSLARGDKLSGVTTRDEGVTTRDVPSGDKAVSPEPKTIKEPGATDESLFPDEPMTPKVIEKITHDEIVQRIANAAAIGAERKRHVGIASPKSEKDAFVEEIAGVIATLMDYEHPTKDCNKVAAKLYEKHYDKDWLLDEFHYIGNTGEFRKSGASPYWLPNKLENAWAKHQNAELFNFVT